MDVSAVALIMLFGLALFAGVLIIALSAWIGHCKSPPQRSTTYECGIEPIGTPRQRFAVKFFLIAMLFMILDVGIVFLYPWAVIFRSAAGGGHGLVLFMEIVIFLCLVALVLLYAWGRGALEWEN